MSLTIAQKIQLLIHLIDKTEKLARKFVLDSAIKDLQKLKKSIEDPTPDKAYFEDRLETFTGTVFKDFGLESTTELRNTFKNFLNPSDKTIKEYGDFNQLSESIASNLSEFISDKFTILSPYLKNLRLKLNNLIEIKDEKNQNPDKEILDQGISFKSFVDFLESQRRPIAFYKDITPRGQKKEERMLVIISENSFSKLMTEFQVGNLYNLMYLVKGMDNPKIAQMLFPYFKLEDEYSKHLVWTLFAVEDSDNYCRNQTMVIRAMSLFVNANQGDAVAGAFSTEFNRLDINPSGDRSAKAYLQQFNAVTSKPGSRKDTTNPFYNLMENVLSTIDTFKPILMLANQELIVRDLDEKTHKHMIKFAFYMGVVCPIIENTTYTKMVANWPENQKVQLNQMRAELSNAFMVLLGLVSLSKLDKNPLYTLAMDDELQKKVTTAFAFHNDAESQKKDEKGFTFHPAKTVTKERSQSFGSLDDHKKEIVKEKPPIDASVSDPVLSSGTPAQKNQGKILADQLRKRTGSVVAPKRDVVKPPSPKLTASQSPNIPASPKKTHFRENAGIFKPLNASQKTENNPPENNTNSPKKK
ncbi:MAG: hypothetical protein Q8M40_00195 [Legionella sp.]|nr:hypothetical protein [Legionella sp.]